MPTARPTPTPAWGTTAGRRTEPSAGEKSNGWGGGNRPPAKKVNWLWGILSDWVTYFSEFISSGGEFVYQTPIARTKFISAVCGTSWWHVANARPHWAANSYGSGPSQVGIMQSIEDAGFLYIPISEHIPRDAVITAIRIRVNPGAARATTGNRMQAWYFDRNASAQSSSGPLTTGTTTPYDDGTTNEHFMPQDATPANRGFTGLSIANDETNRIVVAVQAGNDGATNNDQVIGVSVDFTQPGPMF